jgi:hypothetical protein
MRVSPTRGWPFFPGACQRLPSASTRRSGKPHCSTAAEPLSLLAFSNTLMELQPCIPSMDRAIRPPRVIQPKVIASASGTRPAGSGGQPWQAVSWPRPRCWPHSRCWS